MITGKIKTISVDENSLVAEVDAGASDIVEAVLYGLAGVSDYPLPGDEVVISDTGSEYVIVAVFRGVPGGIGSGESILYSRDSGGNIAASVKCGSNGEVIVNGGTDYAAAFNALKSGFDALVDDHNDAVAAINAVAAAVPYTIVPPLLPSTSSIDASKVEKVRL
jgi:hypothetical protein